MNKKTNLKSFLLISVFLLAIGTTAAGKIIFVDANAPGPTHDGSSWANAYKYLQDGLTDANSSAKPVEIRVAQGIYKPDEGIGTMPGDRTATFQLINNVTLEGGYAGLDQPDPNERDITKYETILSGDLNGNDVDVGVLYYLWSHPTRTDNSYHVVTGSGTDETAVLDGLTITDGHASSSGGGGMVNIGGNPTLRNCRFSRNSAMYSAGMYNWSGSPVLTNCVFIGNSVEHFGSGMCNKQKSSPKLTNCIFTRNAAEVIGGAGMSNHNSSPTLRNCTFKGNLTRGLGGAMCNERKSSPTLTNCTFSGNLGGMQTGAMNNYDSSPTLNNCILWANSPGQVCDHNSTTLISYSDVQGGWQGEGNIDADPCFVDAGHWEDPCNTPDDLWDDVWIDGDYHLKSQAGRWDANSESWVKDYVSSPCIDAGNPGCPVGDEPAPNGNRRNMGAYGGTAKASKSPANWRSIADLTNDWVVDSNDLKVFVNYWLEAGECIPSDFNRSQSVDFNDFAIFGMEWMGGN